VLVSEPAVLTTRSLDGAEGALVLAAARRCFSRYGIQRTRMEDVAREAGLPRQYLYRFVSSRAELMEAVVLERLREIVDELVSVVETRAPFAEVMVEVALGTIELTRDDAEFKQMFEASPSREFYEMLIGPNPRVRDLGRELLGAMFENARQAGELRPDLSDDDVVDWLRGFALMMFLRQDLDSAGRRRMLETFFLPALVPSNPGAPRPRRRRPAQAAD
jgi:AcrR family transcriptional regulator